MFGKLLKYEFKSTAKWYLLITLIALGLSVITGVIGGSATNGFVDMETNSMQIITGTLGILIFGGVIGLYLSNYYIIIRRFYSNLYGREGYLTWTLPASPHAIILSKFVGALVASLYCLFLLFFSGFITIIVMGAVIGQDLSPVFSIIAEAFSHSIAYWIIIWWIFTTASPKSSWIEGYSVFLSLVYCVKYHRYSSQSIKRFICCRICIGLWKY